MTTDLNLFLLVRKSGLVTLVVIERLGKSQTPCVNVRANIKIDIMSRKISF